MSPVLLTFPSVLCLCSSTCVCLQHTFSQGKSVSAAMFLRVGGETGGGGGGGGDDGGKGGR